ncbi:MAG: T9SS type A sorting domain-containing protein [Saprospiraceae bacterium]|nr:T9SS type A sorting domain-containing protein [Saprospiraceae bacterium]
MNPFKFSFAFLFSLLCFSTLWSQCFSEQNFTTSGESMFTIPGAVSENYTVEIEVRGADGGDFLWGVNPQTDGGEGATLKGSFILQGGDELLIIVGQSGFDALGSPGGGGGGGGTAVIINNTDVLIAAGAGGGGGQGAINTGEGGQANLNSSPEGGAGLGSSGGGGFNSPGEDGAAGSGGGAGTLMGQGLGGTAGVVAGAGGNGFGAGGGGSGTVGGGGGGYKGGDGSDGTTDKNGKGGDSFLNSLYSGSIIFNTAGQNGGGVNLDGYVILTCIPQNGVEINLVEKIDPLCFGGFEGSIEVEAIGGVEPYQFSLNGGLFGDASLFTGLSEGDYVVTVQDGSGSTDMLSITLNEPTEVVAEILNVVDNTCFGGSGGSIEVAASGGTVASGVYGYSINGSPVQDNGLFENLSNGFYVITIFDDNQCTDQVSATINSPEDLDLIVVSKGNITCNGMDDGFCFVEAFGGTGTYLFAIDGGVFESSSQFFDLSEGTHVISVMDELNCTEEIIVFIDEPDALTFDIEVSDVICAGDQTGSISIINVMGNDPFQYQLDTGSLVSNPIFSELLASEYTVTVIDSSGCTWTDEVEVAEPNELVLTSTITDVLCGGDSSGVVVLEIENGIGDIIFSLDQNFNFSGVFENLQAGLYEIGATDSLGCSIQDSIEIQENATFVLNIDVIDSISCFGASNGGIAIGVEGGISPYQFSLDGTSFQDSSTFSNLEGGIYQVQVIDSTGCSNSIEVNIYEPDSLQLGFFDIEHVACYGDSTASIALSIQGGTSNYVFMMDSFSLSINESDTLQFDSLSSGNFIFSITDLNGCSFMDSIHISQNDSLQLFVSMLQPDDCGPTNTGAVDLNAVGGFAPFQFSLNQMTDSLGLFEELEAGEYIASVVDSLGCSQSLIFSVPMEEGITIDSIQVEHVSCHGENDGSIDVYISNEVGDVSYMLNEEMFEEVPIDNLSGGDYILEVVDSLGCRTSVDFDIHEPDPLVVQILDVDWTEGIISVSAIGGTPPFQFSIDNKMTYQDSSTFFNLIPGDYLIHVKDENGCETEVQYILVGVEEEINKSINIYPNPVHDFLRIELGQGVKEGKCQIFDQMGRMVKEMEFGARSEHQSTWDVFVGDILNGTYLMKVKLGNEHKVISLVVVH